MWVGMYLKYLMLRKFLTPRSLRLRLWINIKIVSSETIIYHYIINLSSHPWQQQWPLKYLISLSIVENLIQILLPPDMQYFNSIQTTGGVGHSSVLKGFIIM